MKISAGNHSHLEAIGSLSAGTVFTLDTVVYVKGASRYTTSNTYTCECTTLSGGTQVKLSGDTQVRVHRSAELFLND